MIASEQRPKESDSRSQPVYCGPPKSGPGSHLEPREIHVFAHTPRRVEQLAWLVKQCGGRVTLTPEDEQEAAELMLVESRDASGSRILTHAKKGMGS